jgi:Mu-like prophage major head subunit gpT
LGGASGTQGGSGDVVPGATGSASATIAAAQNFDDLRADLRAEFREQQAAETTRINSIRRLCAANSGVQITVDDNEVDLEAHAIATEDFTPERVELEILRASRPTGPAIHIADTGAPANDVIEAALCRTGKLSTDTLEASFDDKTLSAADRHYRRGIGLQEMLLQAAFANGYSGRGFRLHNGNLNEVLRAAFTTADLSGILSNSANKFLLESFNFVESVWREIAAIGQVGDFKTHTRYRLTGDAEFEQVGQDGKLKHGTLGEDNFTTQADTYGKIYSITRTMLIDDDLDALSQLQRRIGRGSALKLNKVFWALFINNSTFFTTARKNYFTGGTSALDSGSLQTAEQMFLDQTDQEGNPLGAMPSLLLVPTGLGVTARELFVSTNINTGGSSTKTKVPSTNIWSGKYRPVVSTYLSNAAFTGNSALAWFLLSDPRDLATIEVAFLNGVETPTVESADADFDQLGIQMRGYFDFGVGTQEYRGGVKSKGEA